MILFLVGMGGAFVTYVIVHILPLLTDLKRSRGTTKWRLRFTVLTVVVWVGEMAFFLVCGGLIAIFFVGATTNTEAFLAGMSWQGLASGYLATMQLQSQVVTQVPSPKPPALPKKGLVGKAGKGKPPPP